ncbi:MAG: hypothetical protein GXP09_06050 [Gammaproteobacteria bacterium]|nr:hypothetical protein [Gammaproteobacteria bacterium]
MLSVAKGTDAAEGFAEGSVSVFNEIIFGVVDAILKIIWTYMGITIAAAIILSIAVWATLRMTSKSKA